MKIGDPRSIFHAEFNATLNFLLDDRMFESLIADNRRIVGTAFMIGYIWDGTSSFTFDTMIHSVAVFH